MKSTRVAMASLVIGLAAASTVFAEYVEVVTDSALVKVGDTVIATVEKGERLEVLRRDGPWVAVTLKTPEGEREGWIFANRV